jgi:hypothetical protein
MVLVGLSTCPSPSQRYMTDGFRIPRHNDAAKVKTLWCCLSASLPTCFHRRLAFETEMSMVSSDKFSSARKCSSQRKGRDRQVTVLYRPVRRQQQCEQVGPVFQLTFDLHPFVPPDKRIRQNDTFQSGGDSCNSGNNVIAKLNRLGMGSGG